MPEQKPKARIITDPLWDEGRIDPTTNVSETIDERATKLANRSKTLGTATSTEYPIGGRLLGTKLDTDNRHPLTIISESLEKLLSDEES